MGKIHRWIPILLRQLFKRLRLVYASRWWRLYHHGESAIFSYPIRVPMIRYTSDVATNPSRNKDTSPEDRERSWVGKLWDAWWKKDFKSREMIIVRRRISIPIMPLMTLKLGNVWKGGSRSRRWSGCGRSQKILSIHARRSFTPVKLIRKYWYWKYIKYPEQPGMNCCSDSVIGFHYMDASKMRQAEYFIYKVHLPHE